jgi:hypothetical protein
VRRFCQPYRKFASGAKVALGCAQRSATLTRTWPNLISNEGVKGLENSKWSVDAEPEHNVTLPFTRMFLGPMDYTPGAMLNATKATFAQIFDRPMALGTRRKRNRKKARRETE